MLAHDPNAVIVFQDEVHFMVQASIREKWAKIGSEPRVKSKPGKESVSYSGFVVYGTGQLLIYKPSWFTYETTIEMLHSFLADIEIKEGQTIYMSFSTCLKKPYFTRLLGNFKNPICLIFPDVPPSDYVNFF